MFKQIFKLSTIAIITISITSCSSPKSEAKKNKSNTDIYIRTAKDIASDKIVAETERWPNIVHYPENIIEKDLIYSSPDDHDLALTYFTQKETESLRPAILFVHGGGWNHGDRRAFFRQSVYLTQRYNLFSVNIDYRLAQTAKYPAALIDCKTAVRWIRANAEEHKVDTSKIIIVGGSAGAHLASLTALTKEKEFEKGLYLNHNSDVHLAVLFNGHFDMNDQLKDHVQDGDMYDFFGGHPWEIPEVYGSASPFLRVNKDTPPMLFLHGDKDNYPHRQSIAMHERLKYYGVYSEVEIYEGIYHAWFNHPDHCPPTTQRMEKFIVERLELTAPSQKVLDESIEILKNQEDPRKK